MASARKPPQSVCVLVVEDIAEIREAMVETLQRAGYQTEGAADAKAALVLMRRDPTPDLLFTDIVLGRGLQVSDYVGIIIAILIIVYLFTPRVRQAFGRA